MPRVHEQQGDHMLQEEMPHHGEADLQADSSHRDYGPIAPHHYFEPHQANHPAHHLKDANRII